MAGNVRYEVADTVALIALDNPPVNALSLDVRRGIAASLSQAEADPNVDAIVLIGSDRAFCGGADIGEMGKAQASEEPILPSVILALESSSKPVVAAIGGVCMGGGLELAMGAHYRIASRDANLALPEVKLGLLPGAGGTQRLPRAIGLEKSIDFILGGNPATAEEFGNTQLIDHRADKDLASEAIDFARQLVAVRAPLRRLSDLKVDDTEAARLLDAVRGRVAATAIHYPAPAKIVDCLQAAVDMPFRAGLRFERERFLELRETSVHRALRYAFQAERASSKIPDVPADTPTRRIETVAVVGAGTMGRGIAMNFLNVGIPVTLKDTDPETAEHGVQTIRALYEGSVKRKRLTEEDLTQRLGLLTVGSGDVDFENADLVIEAVFEDMGLKETVFRHLDRVAKPGAILATNTSTLDVNRIASFTRRPQDVVGTHFFSPANVMRLLEVVRGDKTSTDVLATMMKLGKAIKKTPVLAGVCDGFIGNRMLEHYVRMAGLMVEQGSLPWQVDQALERWGMIMGPFRVGDLAGNDIGWAIRKRRYVEKPHVRYAKVADRICELGRFGQKTGKGWYLYKDGDRTPIPDPEVEEIIVQYRRDHGIEPRQFGDKEIVERCIYALINEGARILEEGIALRASDIDVVYLTGYGFPRFRGGPMRYADDIGLSRIVQTMESFREESGDGFWEPAAMLTELIEEAGRFT